MDNEKCCEKCSRQSPDVEGAIELIDDLRKNIKISYGMSYHETMKRLTTIKNKLQGVSNEQD